jgi:lactate 2-monooxygenase
VQAHPHPGRLRDQLNLEPNNPTLNSGGLSIGDSPAALTRGATAVGIGRPYAYALSYGGAERLTHFLHSFLAELDLCMAICGFKVASLKDAGCEQATDLQK